MVLGSRFLLSVYSPGKYMYLNYLNTIAVLVCFVELSPKKNLSIMYVQTYMYTIYQYIIQVPSSYESFESSHETKAFMLLL